MDKENKVRKADGIVVSMGDGNDVVVTIPVKIPVLEVMGRQNVLCHTEEIFHVQNDISIHFRNILVAIKGETIEKENI